MSLSTYYLNQRISILQSEINALQSGGLPTSSNLAVVLANGNSAGTTDINMNSKDILAVDNIDLVTINGSAYPPTSGTATNIAGGIASQIPFQSAPSTTSFIANGTSGQYLKSNGTATPSWATIPVIPATPNLTQVLTAGSNAASPLTLSIQDTTLSTATTLFGTAVDIELNDGINPPQLTSFSYSGITHTGNAPGNNFTISTDEALILTSDNLNMTASTLGITSSTTGYTSSPALLINNTDATAGATNGVPSIELTKSGRNGAVNDVTGSIFFNALDSAGVERTFGKMESRITTTTAPSNHDGALDFYSLINSVNQLVFRLNGADNENNSFRPLDLNGNALKTSTTNLTIDATASTGTGQIIISPKTTSDLLVNSSISVPAITNNISVGTSADNSFTKVKDVGIEITGLSGLHLSGIESSPSSQYLFLDRYSPSSLAYADLQLSNTATDSILSLTSNTLTDNLRVQSTGSISLDPTANLIFTNLPTSAVGLPTGAVWNNLGVLNIAP
jgi:hypothetical protein